MKNGHDLIAQYLIQIGNRDFIILQKFRQHIDLRKNRPNIFFGRKNYLLLTLLMKLFLGIFFMDNEFPLKGYIFYLTLL
jgi:hypothetical protein